MVYYILLPYAHNFQIKFHGYNTFLCLQINTVKKYLQEKNKNWNQVMCRKIYFLRKYFY